MSEHNRDRPNRMLVPEKPKHPLGWACENCFHVGKDPGSAQMKCTRNPPTAQLITNNMGQVMATASVFPPVNAGEWCGEYAVAPASLIA